MLIDRIVNAWAGAVTQTGSFSYPARKAGSGIGVVEAPRGTLVHNISIDSSLGLSACTLTVPTTINAPAI